ncbi:MAG: hypothetical protein LBI10_07105 [Deltaproteobacteria bacterium]|nr:hypothetical protein [Deltaproteobacteria bacterium]
MTGVLQGTLSSATPVVGDQVTGGSLTINYPATPPPPATFPISIPIIDGDVNALP